MANNSFRDSVNSLGWSRRDPDLPVNTGTSSNTPFLSRLQSYNPFGEGGYVQLPTHNEGPGAPLPAPTRREEEEGFFALSRWDRMLIFGACNLGAAICFMICFFLFPVLSLKPRKFAVLWSVGSVLFLLSWAVLMGPWTYAKHLVSGSRLPFTAAYFGAIALTLYFAIGRQNLFLTLISSIFQLAALVWYLVSYFPMGSTGLHLVGDDGDDEHACAGLDGIREGLTLDGEDRAVCEPGTMEEDEAGGATFDVDAVTRVPFISHNPRMKPALFACATGAEPYNWHSFALTTKSHDWQVLMLSHSLAHSDGDK
ncbi:hypothetical protein LT330_007641 [Penicillium expansum]|nr:hypothetical protein LT330_007641 [Penicillium expansum]